LISHRDHKEHRALIWIAERAIQIKLLTSYRWKFTPPGVEGWSDFGDLSRILRDQKIISKKWLCVLCELERFKSGREIIRLKFTNRIRNNIYEIRYLVQD